MSTIPEGRTKWFDFNTRDLVYMAILIAAAGVFQTFWAHLVFQAQVLGPFRGLFASFGFNVVSFLVLYLVRKPGAATIVKTVAGVIELLLGNPVGPVVIFYGLAEGIAADIAFVLFNQKITLQMIIAGSLLAWLIAAPVDAYRDAVPLTVEGLATYFGPGGVSKVWISLWVYLTLKLLRSMNIGNKQAMSGGSL